MYRIGNLTLLHKLLNQNARNFAFARKKTDYALSAITLTKSLCGIPNWNAGRINNRSEKLFDLAWQIWAL